jgi:hypothetical protein
VKIATPDNPFGVAKPDAIAYTLEKRKELLRKVAELKRPLGMKDLDSIEGILINAIEEDHVFVEQLLASLEDEIALKVVGKYSDRLTWYISSKPQEMRELINSTVWTNSNSAAVAGISNADSSGQRNREDWQGARGCGSFRLNDQAEPKCRTTAA